MQISVHLFNQSDFENFENKKILQNLGFEAKYEQTSFLPESCTLFVGLEMKKVKTFDPFYKVDFFHLGAKIAENLTKMKIEQIEIDYISEFPVSEFPKLFVDFESEKSKKLSKNLLDLQLGIKQKLWKFDKYKTNLQKENSETLENSTLGNQTLKNLEKPKIKIRLCSNLANQFSEFDALKLRSLNMGMSLNRFVVEETPENFNPKTAVEIVQKELGNYENVEIKVRDYDWLLENGFGGVCAVGKASENKPNLIHAKLTLGENKIQNPNSQKSYQNSFKTESENVKIRKVEERDLKQMFEILKNCRIEIQTNEKLGLTRENAANFDAQKSFENLQKEFNQNNSTFWLLENKVENKSEIIGFSEIIQMENCVELDKICLKKEFQNQGLGSHLLAHTLQNIEAKNQNIKVEVVQFNEKAIKFYEKFGFKKSEARIEPFIQPSGKKIPAIEMVLESEKLAEIKEKMEKNSFKKQSENKSKNLRQTDKVLTFGTPNYDLKIPRENVRGVLFDPKTQKYCLVQMENLPFFLVGGDTDGQTLETALAREIREELGYTDFEIVSKLGKEILSYCPREKVDKLEKCFCSETGFLVILNSQNQKETELSQMEKQKKLTKIWQTSEEISQIWQTDQNNNPQLKPFWEIFQRGVSKAIQLGLDKTSDSEIFDKEFITRIVLIGKGLTYDTGGLDIKTDGHMKEMKTDMGGSGLMLGVMKTLAEISNKKPQNKEILNNFDLSNPEFQILKKLNQGTNENVVFGKHTGKELQSPERNVRAVIFDPQSNKFCFFLKYDNISPILVGQSTNASANLYKDILALLIDNKLGYVDFEIYEQLGEPIISYLYLLGDKPKHIFASDIGFLVVLNSLKTVETRLTEHQKLTDLKGVWLTAEEVLDIWNKKLIEKKGLDYARDLEIFRRGLEKLEELGIGNSQSPYLGSTDEVGEGSVVSNTATPPPTAEPLNSGTSATNPNIKQGWDIETLQIETERLILKPISLDFAEEIFEEFTSEVARFLFVQTTGKIEDRIEFIQKAIQKNQAKTDLICLILNKNNEFLGLVGLHHLTDRPSFGIWLKKSAQNQGFGKETIQNLSNWAFENLNLSHIKYEIFEKNSQSQKKLIESIGGQFVQKYTKTKNEITVEILEYQIKNPNYQESSLSNQTENTENSNSELKTLQNILNGRTLEIHWLTAFCENSVNSNSYRSDDILTSFSGQTVEIWNTDAEGRLTLADVLSYATLFEPDFIVDAATLTGACVVANSCYFTGLVGNDENLNQSLITSFVDNNEPTVQNHFPEMLRESVCGDLGDLVNTGKLQRQAGHITAGLFLSHFIDQNNWRPQILEKYQIKNPKTYAWTHLDIAGTSFNKKQNALETQGATGQNVRSLVDWILSLIYKHNL